MNVLIFNPPGLDNLGFVREGRCEQRLSSFQYVMLPVTLPTIGALLKQHDFNVRIIDAVAEKMTWFELTSQIKKIDPQLIIFNISTVTYNNDIIIAERLKKTIPNAHFTSIGVHVTSIFHDVLRESVFDSVIRSEPELIALNLAKALKTHQSLEVVNGLVFKNNDGTIVVNKPEELIKDLDSLPFPDRSLVNNDLYTLPVVNKPYTLLVPSRGCPYNCTFCTAHFYYGKQTRFRSVDNVIEELKEIVNTYNIHYVTMWSDTFTLRKDFVIEISKKIIEENLVLQWMCNSRVDSIDEEMLIWMKKSGCIGISFGIESGSQEILNNVKKGITVEQIQRAIKLTNKVGIESLAHVILGLKGDTKEKILNTIKFVKKLKPSYAQFYCAVPFPGTEFYKEAIEQHWLTTDNWSKFEINNAIISTPLLKADELNKLRKKAYLQFYLSVPYVWGRLKKIKSLKDFFLTIRQGIDFIRNWIS